MSIKRLFLDTVNGNFVEAWTYFTAYKKVQKVCRDNLQIPPKYHHVILVDSEVDLLSWNSFIDIPNEASARSDLAKLKVQLSGEDYDRILFLTKGWNEAKYGFVFCEGSCYKKDED